MSDIQDPMRQLGAEVLFLLPEKILTDERFDVRPSIREDTAETKEVEGLARMIEQVGQQEAGIVIPGKREGDYTLIAGHRRRRALILLNAERSSGGQTLIRMRVIVDRTAGDPRRKAIINNVHRKSYSPITLALLIQQTEKENNWPADNMLSHKKCMEYLGLGSPAQVTQHLRLLKLDKSTQLAIHSGEISKQSAFDMINSDLNAAQQREVISKGRQEQTAKIAQSSKTTGEFEQKVAAKGNKVENPAIKAAIKDVKADAGEAAIIKKSKAEIIEFFEEMDGPAYGHANSAVRIFVRYFVEEWVNGSGNDKKLSKLFDAVSAGSDKGTESVTKPAAKAAPAAPAAKPAPVADKSTPKPVTKPPIKPAKKPVEKTPAKAAPKSPPKTASKPVPAAKAAPAAKKPETAAAA